MISDHAPRRILIVDDQQAIHDTFDRLFAERRCDDAELSDFERRFLDSPEDLDAGKGIPRHRGVKPAYLLEHASSGERAVEMVTDAVRERRSFSVAFVDMRMPCGMDGMETTEMLWQRDPNLQVVICTAYSDHVWEDVVQRLGYTDRLLLLKKPFESDEARQLALALSEKSRLAQIQQKEVHDLGREVERRRDAEESMRAMAHRDTLTELRNRPYLLEKLSKLIARHHSGSASEDALLFLDLDNFKVINDSLGHDAGDDLLNQVATRLRECVRDHNTASRAGEEADETVRLGGDEFVVLLERLTHPQDAIGIATRIVDRIAEPFVLEDRLVTIGTSVGVAYINRKLKDASEALRNADTAMYRAKHAGKGQIAVFDQTMHEDVVARMELENQLRTAIDRKLFDLNYQPIVSLQSGDIVGVEVLLRWGREDGDDVAPGKFIPIIEEIGMISRVGEWVLETAMRDFMGLLEKMPSEDYPDLSLAVNLSCRQLGDPMFLNRLDAIFERTGFQRTRLKLEVNETSDARSGEQALDTMLNLHDSGIGILVDDFGKGQSSLTCFQAYPIEAVKIDHSFTASIATEHAHAVIAQSIVQLAHHLGARIVAEGVESRNQLESLRMWGCDAAQGYLFAPPLSIDALGRLLADPMRSEGIRMLRGKAMTSLAFETESAPQPFSWAPTPPPRDQIG